MNFSVISRVCIFSMMLFAMVLPGCGVSGVCIENTTQACVCSGGKPGAQLCTSELKWSVCDCGPNSAKAERNQSSEQAPEQGLEQIFDGSSRESIDNYAEMNTDLNEDINESRTENMVVPDIRCTPTGKEVCDGIDNDCDGTIDNVRETGQSCVEKSRKGVCQAGIWKCSGNKLLCHQTTQASNEVCDGLDNDCNGQVDENNPGGGADCTVAGKDGVCSKGKRACQSGSLQCTSSNKPSKEVCDGLDNDCDGSIDNGLSCSCTSDSDCPVLFPKCQQGRCYKFCKKHVECPDAYWCQQGYCQSCPDNGKRSALEVCDDKDNDCDGSVDENYPTKGGACDIGIGACRRKGQLLCNSNATGVECKGNPGTPSSEQCNGIDDDCDGRTDETFFDLGSSCNVGMGECNRTGKKVCKTDGSGTTCDAKPGVGRKEFCDGKDNDCDGQVDELPSASQSCQTGEVCCSGSCVNTSVNSKHCGSCGNVCQGLSVCKNKGCFCRGGSSWEMAKQSSGGTVQGHDLVVDRRGNLYVTGFYTSYISLGSTSLTGSGSTPFVAKMSPNGKWLWSQQPGQAWNQGQGRSIVVDRQGNVYVIGFFTNSLSFGTNTLSSAGDSDIFIAKMSAQGSWIWAQRAGGSNKDEGLGIALDGKGGLYITGTMKSYGAQFGSTNLSTSGDTDLFIARLTTQGKWSWAKSIGYRGADYGYSVTADPQGNAVVTGSFELGVVFGTTTLTTTSRNDIFVAKISSTGKWLWAKRAGGYSYERGYDIVANATGDIYVTGYFGSQAIFGSYTLSTTGSAVFVAKLDSNGSWQWAKKSGTNAFGNSIALQRSGNVLVSGEFKGTMSFGTTVLYGVGGFDFFAAELTPSGNWVWAQQGDSSSNARSYGIASSSFGEALVIGYFDGKLALGTHLLSTSTRTELFVAKVSKANRSTYCSSQCVNTQRDTNHCGSCGNQCKNNQVCVSGKCQTCSPGQSYCNGSCIDLKVDKNHCSTCGNYCDPGEDCCGGTCRDVTGDRANCGSCGNACRVGEHCANGKCTTCPQGESYCNGVCTNTSKDTKNCGACGKVCGGGNVACRSGSCSCVGNPRWQLAVQAGGSNYKNRGIALTVDPKGNTYLVGSFEGYLKLGATTLYGKGTTFVVAKMDSMGNWIWAQQASAQAIDIGIGKSGFLYITGNFAGTLVLGTHTLSSSTSQMFVAKLNSTGKWIWAQKVNVQVEGASVDSSGNVYATGLFSSSAVFGTHTLNSKYKTEVFVAKINTSGVWEWARRAQGDSALLSVNQKGNLWIAGKFSRVSTFGSFTLTTSRKDDFYVALLDTTGKWIWATKANGELQALVGGSGNNVYIAGHLGQSYSNAMFGSFILTSAGSVDGFVAKIDSSGKWTWVFHHNGTDQNRVFDVVLDKQNNVLVVGHSRGRTSFGKLSSTFDYKYGDMFIGKINASGNGEWLIKPTRHSQGEMGQHLTIDQHGNAFVTGYFTYRMYLGTTTLTNPFANDIFVAKLAMPQAYCTSQCVDLQQNNLHCGTCGTSCSSGKTCRNGYCR